MSPLTRDQHGIERAINQIVGIYASQVELVGGEVRAVRAVASPTKEADALARAIISLLRVKFGLEVDARRISVVQVDQGNITLAFSRLQLVAVNETIDHTGYRVEVTLRHGLRMYTGAAASADFVPDKVAVASIATLRALEECLGRSGVLSWHGARVVEMRERKAVLVHVAMETGMGTEHLLGSTFTAEERDLPWAGCRATLDALNRRFAMLK